MHQGDLAVTTRDTLCYEPRPFPYVEHPFRYEIGQILSQGECVVVLRKQDVTPVSWDVYRLVVVLTRSGLTCVTEGALKHL